MDHDAGELWKVVREYATHAVIGGPVLLATGFAPEEFLVHAVREARIPERFLHLWSTGIDVRTAAVVVSQWVSHLQLDWENQANRRCYERLGQGRTVLRFDARGTGLSDRKPTTVSLESWGSFRW